jgi:hypothetical protein
MPLASAAVGALVHDSILEQNLVNEGTLTRCELTQREAERERLTRLDRARLQQ